MARKISENGAGGKPFPVTDFWEELLDCWEGEISDDPLGADHAGRFEAIRAAIRGGHLGPEARAAIVEREQIAELVGHLRLNDPEPVIEQLFQLAGRHLRPVHRKLLGSDLASTAKVLQQVTAAAAKLEQLLDRIPPVTRDFLEQSYVRMPQSLQSGDRLGINELEFTLSGLAHTSHLAGLALARERKRPPKILRQMTLKRAVQIIETATDQTIKHSWKKDEVKYAFTDRNGFVLRDFMKLVEPRVSERSLVEDLIKIRTLKAKHPNK